MRIENDVKLDYKDVLLRPKRSTLGSRAEVDLERKFTFRNYEPNFPDNIEDYHYRGIPIMAANMDGVGTFVMADALAKMGLFTCLVKTYTEKELIDYFNGDSFRTDHVAMSIGISNSDYDKFCKVYLSVGDRLKYLCIDVANGYTESFVTHVKQLRQRYPNIAIIAGNVVTGEMTEELILAGADIIKVGIGPGSVCTTRIQTGVGYPQLSAVIECADAAHGLGGHIIADGGCNTPGDVAKAFAAGADFVMLGGMLAGHDQGGGEIITKTYVTNELASKEELQLMNRVDRGRTWDSSNHIIESKKFVQFYGMSSKSANDKHFGGLKDYRSSEGRTVLTKYKGDVSVTIQDILGGVRSACTYAGASKLKNLSKCATLIRCTETHNRIFENSTIGN
jgi:GMP reductase